MVRFENPRVQENLLRAQLLLRSSCEEIEGQHFLTITLATVSIHSLFSKLTQCFNELWLWLQILSLNNIHTSLTHAEGNSSARVAAAQRLAAGDTACTPSVAVIQQLTYTHAHTLVSLFLPLRSFSISFSLFFLPYILYLRLSPWFPWWQLCAAEITLIGEWDRRGFSLLYMRRDTCMLAQFSTSSTWPVRVQT